MSRPEQPEPAGDPKVQGAERRAWIRYPRRLLTMWQLFGSSRQEECWNATLRDVSQTGLGLVVNRSFPPSTVLTVRLQTGSRKYSRTMLIRVKHCAAQPNGDWLVGCSFVVKLKDEELADLLG
jgi:hypothetical protein